MPGPTSGGLLTMPEEPQPEQGLLGPPPQLSPNDQRALAQQIFNNPPAPDVWNPLTGSGPGPNQMGQMSNAQYRLSDWQANLRAPSDTVINAVYNNWGPDAAALVQGLGPAPDMSSADYSSQNFYPSNWRDYP